MYVHIPKNMMTRKFEKISKKVLKVIDSFPKSKNWLPYLTLADGRKCFFDVFIKKYGLNWETTKYSMSDVARRIRLIEFFDLFIKLNAVEVISRWNIVIDSEFYRMIIWKHYVKKWWYRLVLISFYHHT